MAGPASVSQAAGHAALQRRISDLKLDEMVRLLGFRRDMPRLLAAVDICVLPADAEACGRVLFEAMAMAKPLVATASGGTPEIVVNGVTGLLVRSEEHTSELQSRLHLVCRLLLEKKKYTREIESC